MHLRRIDMRLSLVAGFVLASVAGVAAEPAPPGAKPVRILFVGNSYTDVNNLPGHMQAFLEAKGRKAEIARYTVGGASLRDHWHHNEGTPAPKPAVPAAPARKGGLDKLLKEQGPWDFVVLQGQSQEALAGKPCEFDAYAAKLVAKIREAQPDAKPVLYMTWARQHIPAQQAEITKTYAEAARANRALLAPAGEAWKDAFAAREGLVLHAPDKSHPAARGTYLTACVFYAVLAGESPVGLPARVESSKGGGKPLCELPEEEAKFLQEVAWKTAQRFKAGG
jgi:hypothetical protein